MATKKQILDMIPDFIKTGILYNVKSYNMRTLLNEISKKLINGQENIVPGKNYYVRGVQTDGSTDMIYKEMGEFYGYSQEESDERFSTNERVDELESEILTIAAGTGGKSYLSISQAMAAPHVDNEIFSIDKYLADGITLNPQSGVYAYDSTASGGNRKINELLTKTNVVEIGNHNPVESDSVALELDPIKKITGNVLQTVEGDPQHVTTEPPATSSVSTVHGVSCAAGSIPEPFSKVTIPFAQNPANPVTELEVRIFQNDPTGVLIVKKRVIVEPSGVTHTSVTVDFNEVFDTSGNLWVQILTNKPFAFSRVLPATKLTEALGYPRPKITTTNDLSGTNFPTNQAWFDINLTFNSVDSAFSQPDFTDLGKEKIIGLIHENAASNVYVIGKSWTAIGHSIWWQDGQLYSGTSDIAKGLQTLIQEKVQFTAYNRYCFSGYSLAMTTIGDGSSLLKTSLISTMPTSDVYTYDSMTNDFKRDIPVGLPSDYENNTGALTYYGALRVLHDKLFSLNPKYAMICGNALHRTNGGYTSYSTNTVGATLQNYETALLWVAERLSWKFIDQRRQSGINPYNLGQFTRDGLHPNDAGYAHHYNLWVQEFKKI